MRFNNSLAKFESENHVVEQFRVENISGRLFGEIIVKIYEKQLK